MSMAPWVAVVMIFFANGTFVEVRSPEFGAAPTMPVQAQCGAKLRLLERDINWPAVAWRYGRVETVKRSCRQMGIDEIDL